MGYRIYLPNREGKNGKESYDTNNNIVIVGSNGAGKTRLGSWIEQNVNRTHRISAQKALNLPDIAKLRTLEQADKELLTGSSAPPSMLNSKLRARWGGSPSTFLLNDYEKLLSLLFAKATERDRIYTQESKVKGEYIEVPDSPIDTIIKVWKEIMPHREIAFSNGKVLIRKAGLPEYHGKEMSDGERVTLYLIGQCICVADNTIIIIDEPEIHLHKALVDKLWNKIEELCSNKLLIYITHDLDFAASRMDSNKLWIKNYSNKDLWEWEEIPVDESIPERLIMEIIGSRKNLIFCEGENGSLDSILYQAIFPNFHIIPRGGCGKVIEATKALRSNKSLHHLNAFGIIDTDYRDEKELAALKSHGIFTIPVAEIENLFCTESVIRIVAEYLELNPDEIVAKVIDFIISALKTEFDVQVTSKAEKIIQYHLHTFSKKNNTEEGLKGGLQSTLDTIDIAKIYNECKEIFQKAIDSNNLEQLLLVYNRKSLLSRISGIFGLSAGHFEKLVMRLMRSNKRTQILDGLKNYMPTLE